MNPIGTLLPTDENATPVRSNGHAHPNGRSAPNRPAPYRPGANGHSANADVIGPMERPQPLVKAPVAHDFTPAPIQRAKSFKASWGRSLVRLFVWLWGIVLFLSGIVYDRVSWARVDTDASRAKRLYQIITRLGGTFIKIGQQLAIRNDLLPEVYCVELSKLLDDVKPFPYKEAVKTIEATTGKRLAEVFSRFDPDPIGSGSVACVYQACLRETGRKVVVKVRRPNIGQMFAADFRILHWLFNFLRLINILPEVLTHEFLDELHDTLMEELDFDLEGRHQSLFRSSARKSRWSFFTAPRVFFKFSGNDILVQEFISGIQIKDMLAIVEGHNPAEQDLLRQYDIDPKLVAQRLLQINFWGLWENLFFHADPHPSNIIVQPHSKLVFLDFGSTGLLGRERRTALQQVYDHAENGDVEGAAKASLTLLEPLPPLNVDAILKAIVTRYRYAIVAMRSKGVPWTERTSAQLWLGFFNVTREFEVPINPAIVRLIRGTMLYDTLAARLDNDIDIQREYRRYRKAAGAEAGRQIRHAVKRRKKGPTEEDYLRLEQLIDEGSHLMFRVQRAINVLPLSFDSLGKAFRVVKLLGEMLLRLAIIWGVPVIAYFVYLGIDFYISSPGGFSLLDLEALWELTIDSVVNSPWYSGLVGVLSIILVIQTFGRIFGYLGKSND